MFLSLRCFFWLSSHNGFLPNPISCKALVSAVSAFAETKVCNPTKKFLEHTSFSPELASLESYIRCLCEGRYIQDAIHVFYRLKEAGVCPAIMTWKAA